MAAKLALSSTGPSTILSSPSKLSSPNTVPQTCNAARKRAHQFKILAGFGGGGGDAKVKKEEKKKFITRDEEPEQYWQTAGEREGENPMKTPLPYIIIFGMSTPFIILAVAFLNGWIKVPVR